MVTTSLMLALGCYILWQTLVVKWAAAPLIFGVLLLLFSLFRIRMIWTYFRQKGRRRGV